MVPLPSLPPSISRRDPPNRSPPPFVCLSVGHKGGHRRRRRESHFLLPARLHPSLRPSFLPSVSRLVRIGQRMLDWIWKMERTGERASKRKRERAIQLGTREKLEMSVRCAILGPEEGGELQRVANGGSLSLSGSLLKEKGISLVLGCWSREELLYREHTPAAQFRVDGPSLPSSLPLRARNRK